MIILRQKNYTRDDYLDSDGKSLPLDLVKEIGRDRNKVAKDLKRSRRSILGDYTGKGRPKLLRIFLPDHSGDIKMRNERYTNVLSDASEVASKITRDARDTNYYRKNPIKIV